MSPRRRAETERGGAPPPAPAPKNDGRAARPFFPAAAAACVVLSLLVASVATVVVVFSHAVRGLELSQRNEIARVDERLRSIDAAQAGSALQIQALAALVAREYDETHAYIRNVTAAVGETRDGVEDSIATVQDMRESQQDLMAVQFAGMFTLLVVLVSGYHLSQHLRHLHAPVVQRKIMAVLWMTPLYSVSSWLSLVFERAEPYLAVVREFYESYCVYTFLSFLIAVLGRGDRARVVDLLEERADHLARPDRCRCGPKFWRRCWRGCRDRRGKRRRRRGRGGSNDASDLGGLRRGERVAGAANAPITSPGQLGTIDEDGNYVSPARAKAEDVLDQCQMYAVQFVLLRPLAAVGWLVANELVEPGSFPDWTSPQIYITAVTNLSMFFAFRGLVQFYHATAANLAWCNPWPKFLCIKGVVFMTFWQKMALSLVVNLAYADKFDDPEDAASFVTRAQNFLICLEMLFSAVAHCFVFSPEEWEAGYRERMERRKDEAGERRFGDSVALGDFLSDVKVVLRSKTRRRRRKPAGERPLGAVGHADDTAVSRATSVESEDGSVRSAELGEGDGRKRMSEGDHGADDGGLHSSSLGGGRERLGTEDSAELAELDGGKVSGSMRRIEQFILQHSPGDSSGLV